MVMVGGVTLSNIRRGVAQMASLGYWSGQAFSGQGNITAAVRAVVRHAFELAASRRGVLTSATKSNASRFGYVLWDEVVEDVHADFPEVRVERVLVEAGAAFPDATEEIISTTFDGETLVVRAQFGATFSGPYYGLAPHFGPLSWQIVDHWHLEGGRIVRIAFAADTANAHRQLGIADH